MECHQYSQGGDEDGDNVMESACTCGRSFFFFQLSLSFSLTHSVLKFSSDFLILELHTHTHTGRSASDRSIRLILLDGGR